FDMCFLARQLPLAKALAEVCDDQVLVLDHCGVPDIAGEVFESWAADMANLAKLQHVKVKLSGITAYCAPDKRDEATLKPWVDHVLDIFGPDRVIWGGDWPVVKLGSGLAEWISLTRSLLADLSDDEQNGITQNNARAIYGLA
ncbi:MAG: amidohydrolase family protein, partial [Pseudomonadota bacterium]